MTIPEEPIPPEYKVVTLIQYPNSEDHATGFFYTAPEKGQYLVTNEHVLDPENEDSEECRILLRGRQDAAQLHYRDIDLYDDEGNQAWLSHPTDDDVDIALLPLAINFWKYGNRAIRENKFLPEEVNIKTGEQAMVIGHPFKGQSPYIPVARSALIASPYGVPFEGKKCFATDANMHSGTSGSPVFTIPSAIQNRGGSTTLGGSQQIYFLGVHSANLSAGHDEEEGPLNINLTWYAELIEDILDGD